jgi:fatty-acyl-CoA synthase
MNSTPTSSIPFVPDWLAQRAALTPDRIAIDDQLTGQSYTYFVWNSRANQTAQYLRTLGIGVGDRVAVYATNCMEYLDIWFACGKLGAILQNLNWRLTVTELVGLINDATPRILIYGSDFAEQVASIQAQVTEPLTLIALGQLIPGALRFSDRDRMATVFSDRPLLTPDHAWVICYTGGTTGLPKGAILTHGNMTWNSINTVMSWGVTQDDVAILNAPLFHTGGLNVFTLPLVHVGGKSILCKSFDVEQVFNLIDSAGVTLYFGVPTMFIMMQNHTRWDSMDFSRLKIVISGGAPCPLPVFERFWAKGVDFKTGYGLTEAGPNTFWLPPADVQRKPGAVGLPLFHIAVKVVRSDRSICLPGETGELVIRGAHVTTGYWNNPKATADSIIDGWLHTGDLAVCDEEGFYTIVGRLKDMIISGGENIYPAEIESIMHAYPAIAEAALIGIPDTKWGEVGRAILVLKENMSLNDTAFLNFLQERLARYKVPKSWVVVEALPKTGAGKIDKLSLIQRYGNNK